MRIIASTGFWNGFEDTIFTPSDRYSRLIGPRVRLSERYASIAGRPTLDDPSRRTYRTVGIAAPAIGSIGSTSLFTPSHTASDVLDVPKSRPNLLLILDA